jgi:ribosomal protein S18 acetylase RimI-like enzyme
MLHLQPMTEEEFVAFKVRLVEDYANDIARNYRLPIDETRAGAASEIDGMLSQGLATPNHLLYKVMRVTESDDSRIGYLWIEVDDRKQRCFVAEIYLHPEFRHQGWGRKTLELLETSLKERGVERISLHVFADNRNAQELYTKMGYQPTGITMQKWLTG